MGSVVEQNQTVLQPHRFLNLAHYAAFSKYPVPYRLLSCQSGRKVGNLKP